MTRYVVDHPQDQLRTGGLVAYPDLDAAQQAAGTAATVYALVPVQALDVIDAAQGVVAGWREEPDVSDSDWISDESRRMVAAVDKLAEVTR